MSEQTLVGRLDDVTALPGSVRGVDLRALAPQDRDALAELYLSSYPPGTAVADLAEALAEVDATFAGEYGQLVLPASPVALRAGELVGSVQVVQRSPWDPDLGCPFVIELFVAPHARGAGVAAALLRRSAQACLAAGEEQLALRTGEGTSPAARRLYERAGLRPLPAPA